MRHFTSVVVAALVLPLTVAASGDEERPKSPKATIALKKYDRAVEKAKADYDRAVAAAAKELRAELDVALKGAMKSGSLDEAKAIEAAMPPRRLSAAVRDRLVIHRAAFGVPGGKEVDVSDAVRSACERGVVRDLYAAMAKVPDPAPGQLKVVTISGAYGGVPFVLRAMDGVSFGVEFGAPPE